MPKRQKKENKNQTEKNNNIFVENKGEISSNIEEKIKETLITLNKIDKNKFDELIKQWEFSEQLRKYFEEKHPSLLDEIETKDKLKIYIDTLKNHGFTIQDIITNTKSLEESFKETESEYDVVEKTLKRLKNYCEEESELPKGIFWEFARFAKIDTTPIWVTNESKIKKASDLKWQRNKFLENEKITLNKTVKDESDKIMNPKYAPTTRLLVSGAIKKIRKNLPKNLQDDFKKRFSLPITITSEIQSLSDLKNEWILFLESNRNEIDKDTAKKLDNIKVLNQDLYEEFENEGIDFDRGKWFTEQEQAFRIVFNKLATRQLFDETNKANTIAEMQIQNIGEVFKWFPPYLNDTFDRFPYNETQIKKVVPGFESKIEDINKKIDNFEAKIKELNEKWVGDDADEKKDLISKIKQLKQQKNEEKRLWYAKYITTQDTKLGGALNELIQTKFDLSKVKIEQQQILVNTLVNDKLERIISEGVGKTLNIDEEKFINMIKDFFNIEKKQITIPGPNGDIQFDCLEKKILWGPLLKSLEIGWRGPILTEEDNKNLPLNIKLLLTEDNKDYFERSPIFSDLFQEFHGKDKEETINEWYRVRLKNNKWEPIEWYLSNYPPNWEQNTNNKTSGKWDKDWYLYSKPIIRPEDDRELLFRKDGNPVEINETEEGNYDIDVISRELNLNGKGIWALLFSSTVGQYTQENNLNKKETKRLEESFDKLKKDDLYRDTIDQKEKEENDEEKDKEEDKKESKETESDFNKCIKARKELWGYQTIEDKKDEEGINRYGFENWAKLMIPFFDSKLPPKSGSAGFVSLEIININKKKGTFEIKLSGWETGLGKHEGAIQELPLSAEGIKKIKDSFKKDLFKLPPNTEKNQNNMISILDQAKINWITVSNSFKDIERWGSSWLKKEGNKTENVMYFWKTEVSPGEEMDADSTIETLCKVEYNPNKKRPYTVHVYNKEGGEPERVKTDMDEINFALFIGSRKLSPKTKSEVEQKEAQKNKTEGWPEEANSRWKLVISFATISWFLKWVSKKITDWVKKIGENQTEDLTDAILTEGKLLSKLAGILPGGKLKDAINKVWEDYLIERDNKVWKKIDEWLKFYEADPDFGSGKMRGDKIKPYLDGKIPFKNQRQAAGMLLATTKKWKWPYSRNADRAGKWLRIKILMGNVHQKRYLKMKEKLEKELSEWVNQNGQQRANDKQNEILKLEMKYIVHVIDGRQLRRSDEDVALQEGKFSKKFAAELDERSNAFFKETAWNVYTNTKDISFELARFEYFRLLSDRPQQAIGNLKAVAEKAVTESQWKVFESMVLTGMLCGAFNSITQEDKKMIEKVCRTTWFLPGLLIRKPNVHHEITKLLDIATNNQFTQGSLKYNPSNFDFWKIESGQKIKDFASYEKGFNKRYMANEKAIKGFLSFEWQNAEGKKLTEIYEDTKTPNAMKQVLWDIIEKRYEKNEEFDPEVKANGKSLQQNLLCRNQSLIEDIIKFQDGSFKGNNKDRDSIQDAKDTRTEIGKKIPRKWGESQTDVIFTIKMFVNWFEDKGFNSEHQKFLIRLLKTVKEENAKWHKESAKQMLRYGIVGKIIRNSGNGQVPDELRGWLEAFKDFFENNLNTILSEKVINEWFGPWYIDTLNKPAFEVAPWDEYVKVSVYNKGSYRSDLTPEERKEIDKKKNQYILDKYINSKIYKIANELEEREYGIPNTLKAMYDPDRTKDNTKKQLEVVLGKKAVVLKNHQQINEAKKKEVSPDGMTEEERARIEEEYGDEWGGWENAA